MVIFSCGNCGVSLAKAKVKSHPCKQAKFSCVNCKKEFTSQELVKHSDCIPAAEKKSMGPPKPLPGSKLDTLTVNAKSEKWKIVLLDTLEKSDIDVELKNEIKANIKKNMPPRKMKKLENYLKNCKMAAAAKDFFRGQLFEDATVTFLENQKNDTTVSPTKKDKANKNGTVSHAQELANGKGKKRKIENVVIVGEGTNNLAKTSKRIKTQLEKSTAGVKMQQKSAAVELSPKNKKGKKQRGKEAHKV